MAYYRSKYKRITTKERWHHILIRILIEIHKSFLKKFLNQMDDLQLDHFITPRDHNKSYIECSNKNLSVHKIEILDIIELDQINNILKYFDKLFKTKHCKDINGINREMTFSEQLDLKQWISKSMGSYGFSSYGGLFIISNDRKIEKNDLYDSVEFKCFKTRENYFLLKLEVTPSPKFHSIVKEIIEADIIPVDIPWFFSFHDFIRYKRIIRGMKTPGYPKEKSFTYLLEDLLFQIKKELLCGFNGFYSSLSMTNPHIVILNSKDELSYKDFKIGFGIFSTRACEVFYNESLNFYIINKARYEETNCLFIIGESDSFPEQYNQDKILIHYALSQTVYPSWILLNYFKDYNYQITCLRKIVYKFINQKRNFKFNKQIKIQTNLSRIKIFVNRISVEFTDSNIDHYINSENFDLNKMLLVNNSWSKDLNYYTLANHYIAYYLKEMKSQIMEVEDYFKEISNINLIKTNLRIQFFILVISILGLLLALSNIDKLISLFKSVILIFR